MVPKNMNDAIGEFLSSYARWLNGRYGGIVANIRKNEAQINQWQPMLSGLSGDAVIEHR